MKLVEVVLTILLVWGVILIQVRILELLLAFFLSRIAATEVYLIGQRLFARFGSVRVIGAPSFVQAKEATELIGEGVGRFGFFLFLSHILRLLSLPWVHKGLVLRIVLVTICSQYPDAYRINFEGEL